MKSMIILFVFALTAFNSFAQYKDTEQPDSIYKVNNVKTRIARYKSYGLENCNVNFYDPNGRFIKRIMYDKSGEKKWLEMLFEYNAAGKVIKAISNSYMNHNKVTGRDQPDSILDTSKVFVSFCKFDSLGRLSNTFGEGLHSKTPVITFFYYNPFRTVSKFYKYGDSLMTISITDYDSSYIEKRSFSSYDSGMITKNTWEETYNNIFDKSGRIVKRIKETPSDPEFCLEINYEYNSKGLLIRKTEINGRNNSPNAEWTILFDYDYWDKDQESILYSSNTKSH